MSGSTEKLHERVRALRARAAIQRWEIRQRGHAAGSWFALQRLFALSGRAWIISDQVASVDGVHADLTGGLLDGLVATETPHGKLPERGAIVDTVAVARALKTGKLGGAGIDVFSPEIPPRNHPLLKCERAILSPHSAAPSAAAMPSRTSRASIGRSALRRTRAST